MTMRVGVLGGGQLARMLALAGHPIGVSIVVLDPDRDCPASIAADVIEGAWDDPRAQEALAAAVDVVTFEFENVPVGAIEPIAKRVAVRPALEALRVSQDRLLEKETFGRLGIRTAPFERVDDQPSLERAVATIGLPAVLKTRRLGYDGKGQRVLRERGDVAGAFDALGGVPSILEGFIRFRREMSVLTVRSLDGASVFYPLAENEHVGGILCTSRAPAQVAPALESTARNWARALSSELDYVGALALELFEDDAGLVANEMAPRVHNSGHWTIEGAETSQFENHLRAVVGLPLGSTAPRGLSVMVNLIGTMPDARAILEIPGAHLHDYGKEPRPGRKLGHVTVRGDDASSVDTLAARVRELAWG